MIYPQSNLKTNPATSNMASILSSTCSKSTSRVASDKEIDIQEMFIKGMMEVDAGYSYRCDMFEQVDKLLYLFLNDTATKETIAIVNKQIAESGKLSAVPTPDPLVLGRSEDIIAYLVDTFVLRDPVFEVPIIPNMEYVTTALEDYMRRNANSNRWRANLTQAAQNAVWYNFGPARIDDHKINGIVIKAVSPRSIRYDTSCRIEDLATSGLMASVTEDISIVQALEEINDITSTYLTNWGKKCVTSPNAIKECGVDNGDWEIRKATKYARDCTSSGSSPLSHSRTDWTTKDSEGVKYKDAKVSASQIQRTFLYRRLQPSWFGLDSTKYADDGTGRIPVYKMMYIGKNLISIEPVTKDPYKIPINIGCCYLDTGSEIAFSFSERLDPVQKYNDKINDAKLKAVNDSLTKTIAIDDNIVTVDKRVVRVNSKARADQNFSIDQAYREYRNDPTGLSSLLQTTSDIGDLVSNATGDNRMLQGGHIPGNRSAPESNRLLQTSQARVILRSFAFYATLIEPIQQNIQSRIAETPHVLKYYESNTGKILTVTAEEFTVAQHFFEITDGMLPSSLNVTPEAAQSLINMVAQIPALQQLIDMKTLLTLLSHSQGFKGISKIPSPSVAQNEVFERIREALQAKGEGGELGNEADAIDGSNANNGTGGADNTESPTQAPNVQGQPRQ